MIGIYEIYNMATGKSYIGSSTDIEGRRSKHFRMLKNGNHSNRHLQASYNKYGVGMFIFKVLQETAKEDLRSTEQFWIDFYDATNDDVGYNILPNAGISLGYKHTDETRQKLSAANKGKVVSLETRAKLSAASKGKRNRLGTKQTQEWKDAKSKAMLGNKYWVGRGKK